MGAQQQFHKPDFSNVMDADLDAIRDNYHFLIGVCALGCPTLPGWQTTVTATDYAEPDTITLTRGTKRIIINYTWNADSSVDTIQLGYDDGVSSPGLVWFNSQTISYDDSGNVTGGKEPSTLTSGLISWWALSESSGARYDSHGSNNLTPDVDDIATTTCPLGDTVASFSDVSTEDRFLYSGTYEDLDVTGDWSAFCWFRPSTLTNTGLQLLFGYGAYANSLYHFNNFIIGHQNDDLKLTIVRTGPAGETFTFAGATTDTSNMHFAYVQHDSTTGKVGIRLNGGTLEEFTPTTSIEATDSGSRFQVGDWPSPSYEFGGLRGRTGVWSRVLTSAEVDELYAGGSGVYYGNL